jgi:hypothetical protein
MGAQKLYNWSASSAIEQVASETKAPYLMYEGQDEGFEDMWRQAAVRNFPALKVNKDVMLPGGTHAPLPQRTQVDMGKLGSAMQLLEMSDRALQASTTTLDQTRIEQMGKRRVAHQTIQALQEQSDAGNSHFLHNLKAITLPYEAKVVLDLMAKIYDRPGRVARLLDGEDNERSVMLNQPFVLHPQTKRPVAVQPNTPKAKHFDLRKGAYTVTVDIGKSWQNRLQEGSDEIGGILEHNPELMPLIGPTYFKFRQFPGSKEIAELLKKMRMHQMPWLDKDDETDPATAQAQLSAAQQQVQMLQQQLQQAAQHIQLETAKHQAQVDIKRIDVQGAVALQRMKDATAIAVAKISAAKGLLSDSIGHEEALALAELEHQHALEQAAHGAQIDQAAAAQGAQIDQQAAEQTHAQNLIEAAHEPTPSTGAGA